MIKKLNKNIFLIVKLIFIVLIIFLFFLYLQKEKENKLALEKYPNVILIVVDTLRSDHLSSLGYNKNTTPFLDSLAKESIVFPDITANGSWTVPNVSTILSGLHPFQHQMEESSHPKKNFFWLSEILRNKNFATAAFSANRRINTKYEFHEGFSKYSFYKGKNELAYPNITELIDETSNWLDNRSTKQPFFLYLQPMNVHGPYKSTVAVRNQFLDNTSGTFNYYDEIMNNIMRQNKTEDRTKVTSSYIQDLVNQYDSSVFYTDQQLSGFINDLKQKGIYDNSLIIITSDHGEELYDHGGFSHGYSMYQEIVRIPLLIKPPQNTSEEIKNMIGKKYEEYGEQIDIIPTILNLLEIQPDTNFSGQNLLSDYYQKKLVIIKADWKERCLGSAIIDWPYKLIYTKKDYQNKNEVVELFNLSEDPQEKNDLSEKMPDLKNILQQKLFNSY